MLFKELTMEEFAEIRAREAYGDGKREGRQESQLEIAKKLRALGTSIDVISQSTGLTSGEIERL